MLHGHPSVRAKHAPSAAASPARGVAFGQVLRLAAMSPLRGRYRGGAHGWREVLGEFRALLALVVVADGAVGAHRHRSVPEKFHQADRLPVVDVDGLVRAHFEHAYGAPEVAVSAESKAGIEKSGIVRSQLAHMVRKRHLRCSDDGGSVNPTWW